MKEILRACALHKSFFYRKGLFKTARFDAVKAISFTLNEGETLAVIGGNGSGKSTLAKLLVGMLTPDDGEIYIENEALNQRHFKDRSQLIRLVFQLSDNEFNPRLTIGQILDMPLRLHSSLDKSAREALIIQTLKQVGLSASHRHYRPMRMAEGQRQRVSLARAFILKPKVIIFDESLTMLDISSYSQIINLMLAFQKEYKIAYVFISHNLEMIRHISDQLLVMHKGEMVELGPTETVLSSPQSEITKRVINLFLDNQIPIK